MKTILSIYEKSGKEKNPSSYSKQEVVTKKTSHLTKEARSIGKSKFSDVAKFESSYDLDQYDKYLG